MIETRRALPGIGRGIVAATAIAKRGSVRIIRLMAGDAVGRQLGESALAVAVAGLAGIQRRDRVAAEQPERLAWAVPKPAQAVVLGIRLIAGSQQGPRKPRVAGSLMAAQAGPGALLGRARVLVLLLMRMAAAAVDAQHRAAFLRGRSGEQVKRLEATGAVLRPTMALQALAKRVGGVTIIQRKAGSGLVIKDIVNPVGRAVAGIAVALPLEALAMNVVVTVAVATRALRQISPFAAMAVGAAGGGVPSQQWKARLLAVPERAGRPAALLAVAALAQARTEGAAMRIASLMAGLTVVKTLGGQHEQRPGCRRQVLGCSGPRNLCMAALTAVLRMRMPAAQRIWRIAVVLKTQRRLHLGPALSRVAARAVGECAAQGAMVGLRKMAALTWAAQASEGGQTARPAPVMTPHTRGRAVAAVQLESGRAPVFAGKGRLLARGPDDEASRPERTAVFVVATCATRSSVGRNDCAVVPLALAQLDRDRFVAMQTRLLIEAVDARLTAVT